MLWGGRGSPINHRHDCAGQQQFTVGGGRDRGRGKDLKRRGGERRERERLA